MDPFGFGIILVALGVMIYLLVRVWMGMAQHGRSQHEEKTRFPLSMMDLEKNTDGMLLIQPGGKLVSINERARRIFQIEDGETANLEWLARRIKPADRFLRLIAEEGRAILILDGRLFEVSSHILPIKPDAFLAVILRHSEPDTQRTRGGTAIPEQRLLAVSEFIHQTGEAIGLTNLLTALLQSLDKLITADWMEICVCDSQTGSLIPFRLANSIETGRILERGKEEYALGEGYAGRMAQERRSLLISKLDSDQSNQLLIHQSDHSLHSFLGVPLIQGGELVGTLAVAALIEGRYTQSDLGLVKLLGAQAAVSIRQIKLLEEKGLLTREFDRLQQISQISMETVESNNLLADLIKNISPLLSVEVLGFVLYNEELQILEGRNPFLGLPPQFVDIYRAPFTPVIQSTRTNQKIGPLFVRNAAESVEWENLGLSHLAQAASLHETVLYPLISNNRFLGYLQASNHEYGNKPFEPNEIHILQIFANFSALLLEKADLFQKENRSTYLLESLYRIVLMCASSTTADDVLNYCIRELVHSFRGDLGCLLLADPNQNGLKIHQTSFTSKIPYKIEDIESLTKMETRLRFSITNSQQSFISGDIGNDDKAIPYYQEILAGWGIKSVMLIPLVIGDKALGEIWLGSETAGVYKASDLQIASMAGAQISARIEQNELVSQSDQKLYQQVEELRNEKRLSQELGKQKNLQELCKQILNEIIHLSGSDTGTLLVLDLYHFARLSAIIRTQVGELHAVDLFSIEMEVLEKQKTQIVDQLSLDAFEMSFKGYKCALLIPIQYQPNKSILMILYSQKADHYDMQKMEAVQYLSYQALPFLNIFQKMEDQEQKVEQLHTWLNTLRNTFEEPFRINVRRSLKENLDEILPVIVKSTPFSNAGVYSFEKVNASLKKFTHIGRDLPLLDDLLSTKSSWDEIRGILKPEFLLGDFFLVPEQFLKSITLNTSQSSDDFPVNLLIAPLWDIESRLLGVFWAGSYGKSDSPNLIEIEMIELFLHLATFLFENQRYANVVEAELLELRASREAAVDLADSTQQQITDLVQKDLNQAFSIQQLNNLVSRIKAIPQIIEKINQQKDIQTLFEVLAHEILILFQLNQALIVEIGKSGFELVSTLGDLPANNKLESLLGQPNPLRQLFKGEKFIFVEDVKKLEGIPESPLLRTLGAASFIAFSIEGQKDKSIGLLLVGQAKMTPISEEERHLLTILIEQVNHTFQSLANIEETQQRLQEVILLLDFSQKLAGKNPQGILEVLLEDIMRVMPTAQAGWTALWEEREKQLIPTSVKGFSDIDSILSIHYVLNHEPNKPDGDAGLLPMNAFLSGEPKRVNEIQFAKDYNLSTEDLLSYRKATQGKLPLSSLLIPICWLEKKQGLIVLDNYDVHGAFSIQDEAVAIPLTQQAALALENVRLFVDSERRAAQLQALTQNAGLLTTGLKQNELIDLFIRQIRMVVPNETATLWMRDRDQLTIAAASGFADNESRVDISVALEDSLLFEEMEKTGRPILINDVRLDARFSSLMEYEFLSWLGIPLLSESTLLGIIALEKREPGYYHQEHIQAGLTFASQAAVALERARFFEESMQRSIELQDRSNRLALLNRISSVLGSSLDFDYIIRYTAEQLASALDVSHVTAVMVNEDHEYLVTYETPALVTLPIVLPENALLERLYQSLGAFNTSDVQEDEDLRSLRDAYFSQRKTQSLLMIPLDTAVKMYGWFWLEKGINYRFSPTEIELARTIGNQAAIAIQNARLLAETAQLTNDLEKRVEERTIELRKEHHNTQTLLHITMELSSSLIVEDIITRALAVLNESLGSEQGLILMADGTSRCYKVGLPLIATPQGPTFFEENPEQKIAGMVIEGHTSILINNILEETRWNFVDDRQLNFQSVAAVPLILGQDIIAVLLLLHSQPNRFNDQDLDLLEAGARQISIALNNAEMIEVSRDQSDRLIDMLREQQVDSSRSRAILEAVADGVLVTDSHNAITLFNPSAERILGIEANEILGQPLVHFTGLFGKAAQTWITTINRWSENVLSAQSGETYGERIDLDNGGVVLVHLSPVVLGENFLGTVSIFRDITQEVHLDRLKSDFVANVSHELRTPMTAIKGYVELMLMGASGSLNEPQTQFLTTIGNNTNRLNRLVDDLLDVSQLEAGKSALKLQDQDLKILAEDVLNEIRLYAQEHEKPFEFKLDVEHSLPVVRCDSDKVRQVLKSLVNNGYQYTQPGGKVRVHIFKGDSGIQVDVMDNGIGIKQKDQERIFERFYRGDDPMVLATAGTGLGLVISKTLVEMHNGQIWFCSDGVSGQGSTFSFTIPY